MKALPAILAAFVLVVPVYALAAEDESREPGDEKRKVVVRTTPTEGLVELTREDRANEDKVSMRFSTTEGLLSTTYDHEKQNEDEQVHYDKSMVTRLHQVLEYSDDNDNEQYDPGEVIHSSWFLSPRSEDNTEADTNMTVSWRPLKVSDVEIDGKKGKQIQGRADFIQAPQQPGLPITLPPTGPAVEESYFLVDFTVFGDFLEYQETELAPTEAKIDFNFRNYDFAENGTRLAVVYETSAKDELKGIEGVKTDGLKSTKQLGDREVTTEWKWKDTVNVDGRDVPVHMTDLITETTTQKDSEGTHREARQVYSLDYDRGVNITHDPVLGVDYEVEEQGGILGGVDTPGVAVWAAGLAVLGALVLMRRRR